MAVAFSANVTTWGALAAGPQTSGSFTPAIGSTISVALWDGANTGRTLVYTGTVNTPTAKIVFNDATDANTLGLGEVLSALGGSQTLTVDSSPGGDVVAGVAIIYTGVSTTAYNSHGAPGTAAPTGVATVVPAGSVLVGMCFCTGTPAGALTGSASGGVTPTDRQSGNISVQPFCVSEWVGTGGSITPTWASGSANYVVLQVLLTPPSSGAARRINPYPNKGPLKQNYGARAIGFRQGVAAVAPAGFDASLMAAMQHQLPPTVIAPISVVASGMTPPDQLPT